VELLIVVAVSAVLIGIVLRVASYVNTKTAKSSTAVRVEQIRGMLAEYYSEYGIYPPTSNTDYIYVHTPDGGGDHISAGAALGDIGCHTGLLYYLGPGAGIPYYYNQNPRAARWQHLMTGAGEWLAWMDPRNAAGEVGTEAFWRLQHTFLDGWSRQFRYVCIAPYQSYKLWSDGPNGINENGAGDDIGVAWAE
jgi:type II secretory pathway pseudopilin PulG